jgi:hypothetical protein
MCQSLSAVTFEAGSKLSCIEDHAFWSCSSLSSIVLPSGLQRLTRFALAGSELQSISIEEGNHNFKVSGNFLLDFECKSIHALFGNAQEVTISNTIETLSAGCFSGCRKVCKVAFESDSRVSCIGDSAFYPCSRLSSICIPASVERLGKECFRSCNSLSTVTFESGSRLSSMEEAAFSSCSRLSSICVPAAVGQIGQGCFLQCSSLVTVTFESGSKLSRMEKSAFSCCESLSSICIPASVETIGDSCFARCWRLSTVTFEHGSKLLDLNPAVFQGCQSLSSICLPSSVQIIDATTWEKIKIRVVPDRSGVDTAQTDVITEKENPRADAGTNE